jgi:hypothetical protein
MRHQRLANCAEPVDHFNGPRAPAILGVGLRADGNEKVDRGGGSRKRQERAVVGNALRQASRQQRLGHLVVAHHQRLWRADARASPDQLIPHVRVIAMDADHERRPEIVLVVLAAGVGALIQQESEDVAVAALDGDMQRLRPSTPNRMRADRVDQCWHRHQQRPHIVGNAGTDALQKRCDDLLRSRHAHR